MQPWVVMIACTTAAGACMPLGGLLACSERIHPHWLEREFRHFVIAFGGGLLLAAVSLVLVPQGMAALPEATTAAGAVLAGGVAFFALERVLGRRRREKPQLSAMLLDYLPESLALGGMFAAGLAAAPLLAVLIGLQNLPEGFNAYRELKAAGRASPGHTLGLMCALVPLGPGLGALGWMFLADSAAALGLVMLFAAGGILYLVFQDIAPQARLERHWGPPLGAVCGFSAVLIARGLLGVD